PSDHRLHLGFGDSAADLIAEADVILAIGTDAPWTPSGTVPSNDAVVYYLDEDPLKEDLPLWYMPSDHFIRGDLGVAAAQLADRAEHRDIDEQRRQRRATRAEAVHVSLRAAWDA